MDFPILKGGMSLFPIKGVFLYRGTCCQEMTFECDAKGIGLIDGEELLTPTIAPRR